MKNILRNKKGFTLLEVLVTVGILGVLSAVAIPAYKKYKDGANKTAVKLEVSSGHKAYLAYDTVHNTFCTSLENAGVKTIGTSAIFENANDSFAGFVAGTGCTASDISNQEAPAPIIHTACQLGQGSFKLGAGFVKTGSVAVGYFIGDGDSGPTVTTTPGTCACTTSATATTEPTCLAAACTGAWTPTPTIANLCN